MNLDLYLDYFNKLRPQKIKSRSGKVVAKKLTLRLEKMINEITPQDERFSAVRSQICIEIANRLIK